MKGKMTCAVVLFGLLAASPALGTVFVGFDPPVQFLEVGGPDQTVDIWAHFVDGASILGWGLDFDIEAPAVASWADYGSPQIGDPMLDDWDAAFAPDMDGLAGLAFPDSIAGTPDPNDRILLATVTLHAEPVGVSKLMLSYDEPMVEGFALDPVGFDEDVYFLCGYVHVTPEPATLALLALGGLAMIRRR